MRGIRVQVGGFAVIADYGGYDSVGSLHLLVRRPTSTVSPLGDMPMTAIDRYFEPGGMGHGVGAEAADVTIPSGGWKESGVGPPEHGASDAEFHTRAQAIYGLPD